MPLLQYDPGRDTQQTESFGSAVDVASSSTITSSTVTPITAPISDGGEKRKLGQISASSMESSVPTLATPGVAEAMSCLGTMRRIFPMAREVQKHLEQLTSAAPSTANSTQNIGDGLP